MHIENKLDKQGRILDEIFVILKKNKKKKAKLQMPNFPLQTIADLVSFEKSLKNSESLREDLVYILYTHLM